MTSLQLLDGELRVSGDLTAQSVTSLYSDCSRYSGQYVRVNLQGVERTDSAGLALLVHWYKTEQITSNKIKFLQYSRPAYATGSARWLDRHHSGIVYSMYTGPCFI